MREGTYVCRSRCGRTRTCIWVFPRTTIELHIPYVPSHARCCLKGPFARYLSQRSQSLWSNGHPTPKVSCRCCLGWRPMLTDFSRSGRGRTCIDGFRDRCPANWTTDLWERAHAQRPGLNRRLRVRHPVLDLTELRCKTVPSPRAEVGAHPLYPKPVTRRRDRTQVPRRSRGSRTLKCPGPKPGGLPTSPYSVGPPISSCSKDGKDVLGSAVFPSCHLGSSSPERGLGLSNGPRLSGTLPGGLRPEQRV